MAIRVYFRPVDFELTLYTRTMQFLLNFIHE